MQHPCAGSSIHPGVEDFPSQAKAFKAQKRSDHQLECFEEATSTGSKQSWMAQGNVCGPQKPSVASKLRNTKLENLNPTQDNLHIYGMEGAGCNIEKFSRKRDSFPYSPYFCQTGACRTVLSAEGYGGGNQLTVFEHYRGAFRYAPGASDTRQLYPMSLVPCHTLQRNTGQHQPSSQRSPISWLQPKALPNPARWKSAKRPITETGPA